MASVNLSSAAASSGIDGVIVVSSSRPGPLRKGDPESAPAANLEFVIRKGDDPFAAFTTDAEGHFAVSIPPGHYNILRKDSVSGIGNWQFEADVVAGEVLKAKWTADSGMR